MDEGGDRAQFVLAKEVGCGGSFWFSSTLRWFINMDLYLEIK